MLNVRDVWMTPHEAGLVSLSIESSRKDASIVCRETIVQKRVTRAERKVTIIGLFDLDDLQRLRKGVDEAIACLSIEEQPQKKKKRKTTTLTVKGKVT